jgi:geranylgeranyl diphosphate synthase type II
MWRSAVDISARSLAGVVEMSRQKTATYSFELPLRSAAILAGHEPGRREPSSAEVGKPCSGLSYQLQDDLLSTFGRSEDHGKDAYSDLREGKETALIAVAQPDGCLGAHRTAFRQEGTSVHATEFEEVRSLLSECGAEA